MTYALAAASTGADAVKFQIFVPDEPLFCPLPGDDERAARWEATCMPLSYWRRVADYARKIKIDFLASVFQRTTVRWLGELGCPAVKVASRAAKSFPYGECAGPFLVSIGMHPRTSVPTANTMLLQCVSKYPTPMAEARWDGELPGLSDHSGTIWPGMDAIRRGLPLLEVHFALKRQHAGPDAPVCIGPHGLKALCGAYDGFAALRPRTGG